MTQSQPYQTLKHTPTNLKEALDWMVRVTGEDDPTDGYRQSSIDSLGAALRMILDGEKCKCIDENLRTTFERILETFKEQLGDRIGRNSSPVDKIVQACAFFVGYDKGDGLISGNGIGRKNSGNLTNGYKSSYSTDASWTEFKNNDGDIKEAAKNFPKAITIIYPKLVYLYLKCQRYGDWNKQTFDTRDSSDLAKFLVAEGYDLSKVTTGSTDGAHKNSGAVFANRLKLAFPEFEKINSCIPNCREFFEVFELNDSTTCLENLQKQILEKFKNGSWTCDDCPFTTLFIVSCAYLGFTDPSFTVKVMVPTFLGVAGAAGVAYASYLYGLIPALFA
ncbi:variant erythrocyte surface antigen-1 family protein [Babesia caballi]|uniref:Variant erythrocyte surface antigen-1 family protein n=1 Tax=Babesia caballi TaxID=5871 RepID=A0AAV4LXM9_BABCB|nr:variant erythrocyte surface antigen-1 family protein [Babesia caballi]